MNETGADKRDIAFAVLCDRAGTVRQVLSDPLGLAPLPGRLLTGAMPAAGLGAALDFLADVERLGALSGRQLEMATPDGNQPMQFAGSVVEGGILVIGGGDWREFEHLYTALTGINNELMNRLRLVESERRPSRRSENEPLYEEFTRINNELAAAQRELAKKNAVLAALNEQKNRLLGMAAHDLRNPLGVIMSYAKFLNHMAGAKLDARELQFIAQIEKSSQFMLRLLEDLLDVSQIESGKLNLVLAPVDLAALVRNNVELNRVLAAAKNISIDLDIPGEPVLIDIDANKIEQVLNNLVSNATKYSHAGTTVRVVLETTGSDVRVSVQDQGQGIPAAELDKLFQAFSKTSVQSTAGETSTGLGLAITRKIVEGHGGSMRVDSLVGTGSNFSFSLPARMAPSMTLESEA
ncbi:HAMP domain-containing sensor histidine kinase [Accumulibacter sp.]|uniref:sensor histidine kinase n=1 Tax=Accumulibacter sp. TaxID=2053492 RepID=UPI0028C48B0C|nr:HAMP domain-containing sensor histidine kinase [Accumulibacter sp.]